jgi:hypothetical protein
MSLIALQIFVMDVLESLAVSCSWLCRLLSESLLTRSVSLLLLMALVRSVMLVIFAELFNTLALGFWQ